MKIPSSAFFRRSNAFEAKALLRVAETPSRNGKNEGRTCEVRPSAIGKVTEFFVRKQEVLNSFRSVCKAPPGGGKPHARCRPASGGRSARKSAERRRFFGGRCRESLFFSSAGAAFFLQGVRCSAAATCPFICAAWSFVGAGWSQIRVVTAVEQRFYYVVCFNIFLN